MKRIKQRALLAGLATLLLGACSSDRTGQYSSTTNEAAYRSGEAAQEVARDAAARSGRSSGSMGRDSTGATGSMGSMGSMGMGSMGSMGASGATSATDTAGTTGAAGSTGSAGSTMSSPTTSDQSAYPSSASTAAANSVVTSIEVVPRQSAGVGTGSVAGAAVGGTTESGSSADRVYRITVRMDDGSTRTVTQETAPSFKSGDRVRVVNDMIER